MKYSVSVNEMIFPKYAKIEFKINKVGNLTLSASPSFTPGVLPEGIKPGIIPKGTKIFDFKNSEIVVSLKFEDCLNIIKFNNNRITADKVELYRNSDFYNKKITIVYFPDENTGKPKFATFWFYYKDLKNGETRNFKLPISLTDFDTFCRIIESYVNNFSMIKLYCGVQLQN